MFLVFCVFRVFLGDCVKEVSPTIDIKILKEKIDSLDPIINKALRDALKIEYKKLTGEKEELNQQNKPSSDLFAEMFKKAADEVNRQYIRGTIDYLKKYHPDLNQKIKKMEDRLNDVWIAGIKGNSTLEEFRKVLREWYLLHIKGIEIYKKEGTVKNNMKK